MEEINNKKKRQTNDELYIKVKEKTDKERNTEKKKSLVTGKRYITQERGILLLFFMPSEKKKNLDIIN